MEIIVVLVTTTLIPFRGSPYEQSGVVSIRSNVLGTKDVKCPTSERVDLSIIEQRQLLISSVPPIIPPIIDATH